MKRSAAGVLGGAVVGALMWTTGMITVACATVLWGSILRLPHLHSQDASQFLLSFAVWTVVAALLGGWLHTSYPERSR